MKIKPLFDRILLRPIITKISVGGIFIPSESSERSQMMTVEEIGKDSQAETFKVGDKVLVSKYAGTEVVFGDEKFYVMNQYDILAKLGEDA